MAHLQKYATPLVSVHAHTDAFAGQVERLSGQNNVLVGNLFVFYFVSIWYFDDLL